MYLFYFVHMGVFPADLYEHSRMSEEAIEHSGPRVTNGYRLPHRCNQTRSSARTTAPNS